MTTEREYEEYQERLKQYRKQKRQHKPTYKPNTYKQTTYKPKQSPVNLVLAGIGVISLLMALNNRFSSPITPYRPAQTAPAPQQEIPQSPPTLETTFAVNRKIQAITTDNNTYQFIKASHYDYFDSPTTTWNPQKDSLFLVVEMEVTNRTNITSDIKPKNLRVITDQEFVYHYDPELTDVYRTYYKPTLSLPTPLSSNGKKTIALVYNIDRTARNLEIAYYAGRNHYSIPIGYLSF